ncbi:MAG: hypothetical protein FIA99_03710, partial [Ruminiclostridium sp.]|nr:hypothetical protein [Ruminiclostridium sp.]
MKLLKFAYKAVAWSIVFILGLIIGFILGSYVALHSNPILTFLKNQRTNILIGLGTGLVTSIAVSLLFYIITKYYGMTLLRDRGHGESLNLHFSPNLYHAGSFSLKGGI